MSVKKIVIEPDPILRKKSESVEKVDANLKKLLDHLCSKTQHSDVFICKILPINVDGFFFDKEEVNNNISSLNLFFDTIFFRVENIDFGRPSILQDNPSRRKCFFVSLTNRSINSS